MEPAVGQVLRGKYRIETVLGRGGMGTVALATHLGLGSRVAVKLLRAREDASATVAVRFAREARLAAQIMSEHVVRILDVDVTDAGEPFFVMELLTGTDLGAVVARDGAQPVSRAVDWTLQACEALGEAHARGIVHRDIKPANLFLHDKPDGSRIVKLLDFGISKLHAPDELGVTDTATVVGSPLFMSPEQLLSTKSVDHRTDLWSLGVTLYQLLTGALPFPAESTTALAAHIAASEPIALEQARPDLPAELAAAVMRCVRKSPAERPADVIELAQALAPFVEPGALGSLARVRRARERGLAPAPAAASLEEVTVTASGERWTLSAQRAPAAEAPSAGQERAAAETDPTASRSPAAEPVARHRHRLAAAALAVVVAAGVAATFVRRRSATEPRVSERPVASVAPPVASARLLDSAASPSASATARPATSASLPVVAPRPPPRTPLPPAESAPPASSSAPRRNPADLELK
jgi:serine/threonine-protein kinase